MTRSIRALRGPLWSALLSSVACASPSSAPSAAASMAPTAEVTLAKPPLPAPPPVPLATVDPPEPNLRPWWADLASGLYRRGSQTTVMAVGKSDSHHHPAEGFLQAKVQARLAVRRAAGIVAFSEAMPEPYIEDLFISPDRAFWALYRLDVPGNAGLPDDVAAWTPPTHLRHPGRRRVGRHLFEGSQHLFLECDVEGPIANPDWGQTRATAQR